MELGCAWVTEKARFLFDNAIDIQQVLNLVFHVACRGVYKPVRSKSSRFVASLSAFVASGVFHEWLLSGKILTFHQKGRFFKSQILH